MYMYRVLCTDVTVNLGIKERNHQPKCSIFMAKFSALHATTWHNCTLPNEEARRKQADKKKKKNKVIHKITQKIKVIYQSKTFLKSQDKLSDPFLKSSINIFIHICMYLTSN
jgi:hypothetical protein